MPSPVLPSMLRHSVILTGLMLACASTCTAAQSAQTAEEGVDQRIVLSRTVHARIAYRGLPAQENPVHARATVFPGQVFHAGIHGLTDALVSDEVLAGSLSAGTGHGAFAVIPAGAGSLPSGLAAASTGAARVPLGGGASTGGALGGLGRGLGERITYVFAAPAAGGR